MKILIRLLLKSNLTRVCTVCLDTCLSQYFSLSWHVFIPKTERNDFSVTVRNQHKVSNNVFNKFSWLVVSGLTALRDSISVYIGPSPRRREKEKRND